MKSPINFLGTLEQVDDAIDTNSDLVDEIVSCGLHTFGLVAWKLEHEYFTSGQTRASLHHLEKARSTIRQLFRDWSIDGAPEREETYGPVMEDLEREFGVSTGTKRVKVLVPGAGLGRLVFDVCCKGFIVEGNEISWHQMIASNWIFNHPHTEIGMDLFPFVEQFSNVVSRDQQLQCVKIPDVNIHALLEKAAGKSNIPREDIMLMTAGDFITVYGQEEYSNAYHAVLTVFFIDTAPNLIRYIETIRNCLQPGGVWINNGPLQWHFESRRPGEERQSNQDTQSLVETQEDEDRTSAGANSTNGDQSSAEQSVGIEGPGGFELTSDEIMILIEDMGFSIERHEMRKKGAGYVQNPESMLRSRYQTIHWVARKQ